MIEIVTGLFFGDEGKGQITHNLCKEMDADLVVRFNGCGQAGHTVLFGDTQHVFSSFGSGTLLGIPTYWSEYCSVDPSAARLEYQDLLNKGFTPEICYHPLCSVIMPQDLLSQRKDGKNLLHGTVGSGFKASINRCRKGYALYVVDCLNINVLRAKVDSIVKEIYNGYIFKSLEDIMERWIKDTYEYFNNFSISLFNQVQGENIVFEGAQGTLLDQSHGIMPHCTPSYSTVKNAVKIIKAVDRKDYSVNFVTRPYITRHGNGPAITESREIVINNPYETNKYNDFQGSFRIYPMDFELLKHSIRVNQSYYDSDAIQSVLHVIQHDLLTDDWDSIRDIEGVDKIHYWKFEDRIL